LAQVPVESQRVMPQAVPSTVHLLVQQLPVPSTPQICEKHWLSAVHGEPEGRLLDGPPVVPVELEVDPFVPLPQATAAPITKIPSQFHLATSTSAKGMTAAGWSSRFRRDGGTGQVKFREGASKLQRELERAPEPFSDADAAR